MIVNIGKKVHVQTSYRFLIRLLDRAFTQVYELLYCSKLLLGYRYLGRAGRPAYELVMCQLACYGPDIATTTDLMLQVIENFPSKLY